MGSDFSLGTSLTCVFGCKVTNLASEQRGIYVMTANRVSAVCAGQLTYSGRVRSIALAHFHKNYMRGLDGFWTVAN